jgi:hypothetical protein
MTGRDRIVVIVLAVIAVLAGGWMLVVSPKRQEASKLEAKVTEAQATLSSAEGQLVAARTAQAQYAKAYASIVSLGKAVPPAQEVPSLIYQLSQATKQKNVEFASIVSGAGASTSAPATAAVSSVPGFSQMPFTFIFNGGFFDLEHLFQQLTSFATTSSSGGLKVSGRLLTIQSVKLSPAAGAVAASGKAAVSSLTGTISATAYQLPAGQGLTGTATATSPTGAASPAATTTGAASSPTAPAVARVTP